jgi:hypothetical protein
MITIIKIVSVGRILARHAGKPKFFDIERMLWAKGCATPHVAEARMYRAAMQVKVSEPAMRDITMTLMERRLVSVLLVAYPRELTLEKFNNDFPKAFKALKMPSIAAADAATLE